MKLLICRAEVIIRATDQMGRDFLMHLTQLHGICAMIFAVAFVSCGASQRSKDVHGRANFALVIPYGQAITQINLDLVCAAGQISQSHVLEVANREAVASFGGLPPGNCLATLNAQTTSGTKCAGSKDFTVVSGQTADVLVTLTCQGSNISANGDAEIRSTFSQHACTDDRIKKVYAIPSNLWLGESTVVEVEFHKPAMRGTARGKWSLRNDPEQTAEGTLVTVASCSNGSDGCVRFQCTGSGAKQHRDPRSGFGTSGVWIGFTFEDDECFDKEEVLVECLMHDFAECGNGVLEFLERCDDGNTVSGDGCGASCQIDGECGDGIVQRGEQCDPPNTPVLPACGNVCTRSCQLVPVPVGCGDGCVNQPGEECDVTDGLLPGQVCGTNCKIVPVCGNRIIERGEQCDEPTNLCDSCSRGPIGGCGLCRSTIPDISTFEVAQCRPNEKCSATLSCLLAHPSCWTEIAPAACYCGKTQADIDACENPAFVPTGVCAAEMRAAAGAGASNAEVLSRYYDFDYPLGNATVIFDAAFVACKSACF